MRQPPRLATGRLLPVTLSPCHLVTLSLLLVAGCNWPGKPDPAGRPVPADKVLDFAVLYEQNCSGCHGADGKLGPAPPLNDPLFLTIVPDAELLHVIQEGRPGTPMPAFAKEQGGPLTGAQVKVLAEGIKPRWRKPRAASKEQVPPYLARGAGSAKRGKEVLERGKEVFMRACAVCHGEEGEGIEKDGQLLHRINHPAFLALISDQALRRFVITGRPDLGMPDYAGKRPDEPDFKPLTSTEITDLVALLSVWAPERPGPGREKVRKPAGPARGHE
jgi:cytochrome c oxidase cbb3-type subunit 3